MSELLDQATRWAEKKGHNIIDILKVGAKNEDEFLTIISQDEVNDNHSGSSRIENRFKEDCGQENNKDLHLKEGHNLFCQDLENGHSKFAWLVNEDDEYGDDYDDINGCRTCPFDSDSKNTWVTRGGDKCINCSDKYWYNHDDVDAIPLWVGRTLRQYVQECMATPKMTLRLTL